MTFQPTFHRGAGATVKIVIITPDRNNFAIDRNGRLHFIIVAGSGGERWSRIMKVKESLKGKRLVVSVPVNSATSP